MASATAAVPGALLTRPLGFATRRASLCHQFLTLFLAVPPEMPELGARIGVLRRRANARAAAHLIDDLAARIEGCPEGESERRAWRDGIRERLQQFGHERLGWPDGYRRLLLGDAFFDSSIAFAREARAFNPRFTFEQLGQALRNVWIGNCLQMLLDQRVELRPGLSAYSMLYPVTDNWLDDPDVSSDLKRSFNERFGKRLAGQPVRGVDELDAAVNRLVTRIEQEFPRDDFPCVYASLLAIHDGQMRSLDQHGGAELTDAELLSISVGKGGSSVSADLHLVTRFADPADERFAFGYGVFLQLLDDLQDVEVDRAAGHETLFTRASRRGTLDQLTARLARFIDAVLADERFAGPEFADRIDLIRRNCRALLVGSVADHAKRFSRRFRRHLARQWPLSLRAQPKLRRRAIRRWSEVQSRVDVNGRIAEYLDGGRDGQSGVQATPDWS
jgi:hypothetical protein